MKRKEYLKPEMKVFQLKSKSKLLVNSTMDYHKNKVVEDDDIL